MRTQRQKGIALITALFVLILVTAMAVGMCWMVMTDQRLGGNNQFRETAFYGAEAVSYTHLDVYKRQEVCSRALWRCR